MTDVPVAALTAVIPAGNTLLVPVGPAGVVLSGDAGGWEEVSRRRNRAFPQWKGSGLRHLAVDVLLDGFTTDTPVEAAIAQLRRWCEAVAGQPPVLSVSGEAVPPMALGGRWSINDLTWGDAQRRADGQTVRQAATVDLLEFVDADIVLRSPAAAAQDRVATGAPPPAPPTKNGAVVKASPTAPPAKRKLVPAKTRDPRRVVVPGHGALS